MKKIKNILSEVQYKNVTHGTTTSNAKSILKQGFRLPKRNALFFDAKGKRGNLASIYGSDVIITVDLFPNKIISMHDMRTIIIPEMKQKKLPISEALIHKYLIDQGYDLIDNRNEVIVLDPAIIKIKSVKAL